MISTRPCCWKCRMCCRPYSPTRCNCDRWWKTCSKTPASTPTRAGSSPSTSPWKTSKSSCGSSTTASASPRWICRSSLTSFTAPATQTTRWPVPAWGCPSCARSLRRTRAASGSNRSPMRAAPSLWSFRSSRNSRQKIKRHIRRPVWALGCAF